MKITETVNSVESRELHGPPRDLKRLAEIISLLSTTKADVRVVFDNRSYIDTHSEILMARCDYFKTLLTSDFAESRKRTLDTAGTSERPAKVAKSDAPQLQRPEGSATTTLPSGSKMPHISTPSVRPQAVSASALCKEGTLSTVKVEDDVVQGCDSLIADKEALVDGKVPFKKDSDSSGTPDKARQVCGGADDGSHYSSGSKAFEAPSAAESYDEQDSGELRIAR